MEQDKTSPEPNTSTPKMSEPITGQPLELSSIHGDVSLLTDESGDGIPLNDALIHSTLGSLNDEDPVEAGRPDSRSDNTPSPNVLSTENKNIMDMTVEVPPDSDEDDWLASGRKRGQQSQRSQEGLEDSLLGSAPLPPPKDVSRVSDFDDFGHPNVDTKSDSRTGSSSEVAEPIIETSRYSLTETSDPFGTETRPTGLHKSSDEDDYEVIPAQRDSSNLLDMSDSFQEDKHNMTILDRKTAQEEANKLSSEKLFEKKELQSNSTSYSFSDEKHETDVGASVAAPTSSCFSLRDVSPSVKSEPEPTDPFSKQQLLPEESKKTYTSSTRMEAESTTNTCSGGCPFASGES